MIRYKANSHVTTFCACATILLPIHPSLQDIIKSTGVPTPIITVVFFLPVLITFLTRTYFNKQELQLFFNFVLFLMWILCSALISITLYYSNLSSLSASLRSVVFLMPVSLICAYIAAKDLNYAGASILFFGLAAVFHLSYGLLFDQAVQISGFISLLKDTDVGNYQSTSFYLGIFALAMFALLYHSSVRAAIIGLLSMFTVVGLMGMVGARSTLVALGVTILVALLLSPSKSFFTKLALASVTVFAATLILLKTGLADIDSLSDTFAVIDRFTALNDGTDSSEREALFSSAFAMWLNSTSNFVFGGGLGSFPLFIRMPPEDGWYPHNFIIEILAEAGIIGFLIVAPIAIRMLISVINMNMNYVGYSKAYTSALAIFSVSTYQFIGGIQDLWIPTFFSALFLFSSSRQHHA